MCPAKLKDGRRFADNILNISEITKDTEADEKISVLVNNIYYHTLCYVQLS